jgi:hypothetical protein
MPEELSEDLVARVFLRVEGSVVAIDKFLGTCEVGRESSGSSAMYRSPLRPHAASAVIHSSPVTSAPRSSRPPASMSTRASRSSTSCSQPRTQSALRTRNAQCDVSGLGCASVLSPEARRHPRSGRHSPSAKGVSTTSTRRHSPAADDRATHQAAREVDRPGGPSRATRGPPRSALTAAPRCPAHGSRTTKPRHPRMPERVRVRRRLDALDAVAATAVG